MRIRVTKSFGPSIQPTVRVKEWSRTKRIPGYGIRRSPNVDGSVGVFQLIGKWMGPSCSLARRRDAREGEPCRGRLIRPLIYYYLELRDDGTWRLWDNCRGIVVRRGLGGGGWRLEAGG